MEFLFFTTHSINYQVVTNIVNDNKFDLTITGYWKWNLSIKATKTS